MADVIDAVETPQEAARRLAAASLAQGFKPEALHCYDDSQGRPIYWRVRLRHADGRKWIRPMYVNDEGIFTLGEPPAPAAGKVLYGLHRLAKYPDAVVLLAEGEKACDALTKRGCVATTSGGATSARGADWQPLKGRRVLIWPDFDAPGAQYATDAALALKSIAAEVQILDVAKMNLPPKGDAFEWLAANSEATPADVLALPTLAAPAPTTNTTAAVDLVSAADLHAQPVRWIWPGWLAAGKLHILAGAPGTGKTTIALNIAAAVTAGHALPDGHIPARGRAVIWSAEDDPADTLVPRLMAAGADLSRVQFVGGLRDKGQTYPFDPAQDVPLLAEALRRGAPPSIILVDPIVAAVDGDDHKNGKVRRSLAPLVELAAELGAALLGITHYSKGTAQRDPLERVTGSLAFGALARLVWGTVRQPAAEGETERRMTLARAKSNIGPDGGGFAYSFDVVEVRPGLHASRIQWGEALEGTARELLNEPLPESGEDASATADAVGFLRSLLEDGPMEANAIKRDADAAGYAWRTLHRAADRLGVEKRKEGGGFGGKGAKWRWHLPDSHKMPLSPQDAQDATLSELAPCGHLASCGTQAAEQDAEVEL